MSRPWFNNYIFISEMLYLNKNIRKNIFFIKKGLFCKIIPKNIKKVNSYETFSGKQQRQKSVMTGKVLQKYCHYAIISKEINE